MKKCTKCKQQYEIHDYYIDSRTSKAISVCKFCSIKRSKEYRYSDIGKFKEYKLSAKNRKLEFELSINDFKKIQHNCFYCNENINYIGIDRIDNDLGYIKSNVVPCCNLCNFMKNTMDKDVFLKQVSKIYTYNYGLKK